MCAKIPNFDLNNFKKYNLTNSNKFLLLEFKIQISIACGLLFFTMKSLRTDATHDTSRCHTIEIVPPTSISLIIANNIHILFFLDSFFNYRTYKQEFLVYQHLFFKQFKGSKSLNIIIVIIILFDHLNILLFCFLIIPLFPDSLSSIPGHHVLLVLVF